MLGEGNDLMVQEKDTSDPSLEKSNIKLFFC
jgi:hypothetical protein